MQSWSLLIQSALTSVGINSHKNADVRGVMAPLAKLAAVHGVAVVCVTHLNKGHSND